eukprot:COSAG02_NODE_250_length_27076_cov_24.440618_9_plen_49_part_00
MKEPGQARGSKEKSSYVQLGRVLLHVKRHFVAPAWQFRAGDIASYAMR